jgi:hypothetical protein
LLVRGNLLFPARITDIANINFESLLQRSIVNCRLTQLAVLERRSVNLTRIPRRLYVVHQA